MADPLTEVADRFAPAPTNFFDPTPGVNLMAKYANSRIGAESSGALAESATGLARAREFDRSQRQRGVEDARRAVLWDREDAEYEERMAAKEAEAGFLDTLYDIDETAPDYHKVLTGLVKDLPPTLLEEPKTRAILEIKTRRADAAAKQREAEATKQQTFQNQISLIRERAKQGFASDVTEEDIQKATRADGTLDEFLLGSLAGERKRSWTANEWNRKQDLMQRNKMQLVKINELSKKGQQRRAGIDVILADKEAFPSRVDELVEKRGKPLEQIELEDPEAVRVAKEWDRNQKMNELSAAYSYPSAEAYVEARGRELPEDKKNRRRAVWRHAQESFEETEDDTPSETPATETRIQDDAVPVTATGKQITPEIKADILERAGGDPVKARQIAIDEGY